MILSSTAPADVAKSSHRPACFVPEAICAESCKLPDARGQGNGPSILPLGLGGAGGSWGVGVPVCKCEVHVYVWPEGVVGGAGAGGSEKRCLRG